MARDGMESPMGHFDGDAYLAALRLPTLTLGGRTYTGRLLGFDEWVGFSHRLTGEGAGIKGNTIVDARRFRSLVRDLTGTIYGRGRPWWAFWRPTVAQLLLAAPLGVQIAALTSFSKSQSDQFAADAERLRTTAGTPDPTTP